MMLDVSDLKAKFGPRAREIFSIDQYDFLEDTEPIGFDDEADALAWAINNIPAKAKLQVQLALFNEAAAKDREGFIFIYPLMCDYVYLIQVLACNDYDGDFYFLLRQYRFMAYFSEPVIEDDDDQTDELRWVWAIDGFFNYAPDNILDALIELRSAAPVFI